MGHAINVLSLLHSLLAKTPAFVTTEPPADIAKRLPALIVESSAHAPVQNLARPGAAGQATVALNALASTDAEAFALIDQAYTALWDAVNRPTPYGWITHLRDIQPPMLVSSDASAQGIFQYSCLFQAIIRKESNFIH